MIYKILFILFVLFNLLFSEIFWQKTNGPFGCRIISISLSKNHEIYIGLKEKGILKSKDNALSWTSINTPSNIGSVNSIAVNDSGFIYISCNNTNLYSTNGIYISKDDGNTWAKILDLQGKIYIYNLDTLYISTKYNGIFRSDDSGKNWINLGIQPSSPWAAWDFISDTSGNLWIASPGYITQSHNSLKNIDKESDKWLQGIYFSNDKGYTWENLTANNPDFLVTNITLNNLGDIIASTFPEYDNAYFWSRDYGHSWTLVPNEKQPHASNSLCFYEDSVAFSGTNRGIYKTTNYGEDWEKAQIGLNDVINVVTKGYNGSLIACTNYSILSSYDKGYTWQESSYGLPEIITYSLLIYKDTVFACGNAGGIFTSSNRGDSWTSHRKVNNPEYNYLGNQYFYTLVVNKNNRIFAGSSDYGKLYYSDDGGKSWNVSEFSTMQDNGSVFSLLIDDSNYVYLGTNGAGIWLSKNDGFDIKFSGILNGIVRSLCFAPNGTVYAGTYYQGVFFSKDHGSSWVRINESLPSSPVYSIAISEDNVVYAGTNYGLYRLRGTSWEIVNPNLSDKKIISIYAQGNVQILVEIFT